MPWTDQVLVAQRPTVLVEVLPSEGPLNSPGSLVWLLGGAPLKGCFAASPSASGGVLSVLSLMRLDQSRLHDTESGAPVFAVEICFPGHSGFASHRKCHASAVLFFLATKAMIASTWMCHSGVVAIRRPIGRR